jgi:PAS domain S-box-containing protein
VSALANYIFLLFIVGLAGFILGLLASLRKNNRLLDVAHDEITSDQTWVRAAALGSSLDAIVISDPDGVLSYVNDSFLKTFGYGSLEEVLSVPQTDFWMDPAKSVVVAKALTESGSYQGEAVGRHRDGHPIYFRQSASTINSPHDDTQIAWMASLQDISEERKAQEALNAARDLVHIGEWSFDVSNRVFESDEVTRQILHLPADHIHTDIETMAQGRLDLDDEVEFSEAWAGLMTGTKESSSFSVGWTTPDGEKIYIQSAARARYDDRGKLRQIYGVIQDITAMKEAETQLQQAQKMEAVGQLTGGVAHDFNNLLMAMQLNLEFLADEVRDSAEGLGYIERITHAVEQGASLTRQLLAFSRSQVLSVEAVDVNGLIERQVSLLGRTLPEDIEIDLELAGDLWRARADSVQLESAILNLAINARDAMPSGGVLSFCTENMTLDEASTQSWETPAQGDYVRLSIADNGVGMAADVQEHAVEPFFTTKDVGASGLGLSMAYGFAAQSGGQLIIETELGAGTTMHLYFKRSEDVAQPEVAAPASANAAVGGIETILVVEDDADVRNAVVRGLANKGYVVFSAETGPRAIEWVNDYQGKIDLVLTDMVMPEGMNGREVVDIIVQQHPETKAIFMSGYTDAEIRVGRQLEGGADYIQKPFTMKALTGMIRNLLDAS